MRRLDDEGIADVLRRNGVGVLAVDGGQGAPPYPLPVSFGYDPGEDVLALHLEGGPDSHKHRCLERDRGVGFAVYEATEARDRWRSVVVRGRLVETAYEDVEPAFAALASNMQFTPGPDVWGDSGEVTPFELRVEEWSGREFDV